MTTTDITRAELRELALAARPSPGESSVSLHQWARLVSPARLLRLLDELDRQDRNLRGCKELKIEREKAEQALEDAKVLEADIERDYFSCQDVVMEFYRVVKAYPNHRWPVEIRAAMERVVGEGLHRPRSSNGD